MGKKKGLKEILSNSNETNVLARESSLKLLEEIMIKRFQESRGSNSNKILEFNIQQNPHLFTQALKEIIKNRYKPK